MDDFLFQARAGVLSHLATVQLRWDQGVTNKVSSPSRRPQPFSLYATTIEITVLGFQARAGVLSHVDRKGASVQPNAGMCFKPERASPAM